MNLSRIVIAAALLCAACHKNEPVETTAASGAPRELPPQTVLEHEPNDLQHAQTIPLRAIVRGEITPKKSGPGPVIDDDWFRIEAGKGVKLALHVELAGADPVPSANPTPNLGPLDAQLEVTDRDRNRLVLAHATAGEPAILPAVACAESCFVHVWGAQPAAYTLTVLGALPQEGMELEPDDRAIDANPLAAGKSVQGTIGRPDDEDWYALSANARPGQFLRVELTGVPGVRPLLELRSLNDGALLASFEASADGAGISLRDISLAGEQLVPQPPQLRPDDAGTGAAAEGDAGANAGGANNGTMTSRDADDVARAEGSPAPARELHGAESQPVLPAHEAGNGAAGAEADGGKNVRDPSLPRAGELPGGALDDAGFTDAGPLSNIPAVGSSMQMKSFGSGQDAGVLAQSDGGAQGNASVAAMSDAGVPNAAPANVLPGYYLVVKSAPLTGEKKSPRGANARAAYTLSTALEAGPGDLEQEPNDEPSRATWVAATRTGYLAPAGDIDWYRVRNEGKSVLRAEVTGLQRADLELAIYAPPAKPGDKPALLAKANEGGVREGELLPAVGIDGDALILIQCAQRELDGAKVRDCEDRDTPYTLAISLAADDGALEREPNDDLDHAQPITIPAKITGTLWPKRDVDQFQFTLDAPRTLSFRLSQVRGVDTMLTLRELKTKKGKLAGEVIGTADAAHGDGAEEIVAVPLKAGSYSIEVASPRKDGSATQVYTLQIAP